jgi:hypothetical protein
MVHVQMSSFATSTSSMAYRPAHRFVFWLGAVAGWSAKSSMSSSFTGIDIKSMVGVIPAQGRQLTLNDSGGGQGDRALDPQAGTLRRGAVPGRGTSDGVTAAPSPTDGGRES